MVKVSIPLKSGRIVICGNESWLYWFNVSIPLKSGRIVIPTRCIKSLEIKSFNPLKIGSYCNAIRDNGDTIGFVSIPLKSGRIVILWGRHLCELSSSFNPLKIGSYCNYHAWKVPDMIC